MRKKIRELYTPLEEGPGDDGAGGGDDERPAGHRDNFAREGSAVNPDNAYRNAVN